jgi:chromosome segregation ATPase
MQDTNFKDRELQRLREALAGSQQECSWVQQKQAAAEEALSKAAGASSALQSELRSLQASHDTQQQQLQSLSAAKATAESAAVVAGSRIAALEAQLGSKSTELDQVQLQYKRLLGEQQVELERLRQQLQQQGSELGKLQTSAAQKEQGLLQQLHSFSGSLQDIRASHAADKATAEQLQKQVEQLQRELQDGRASKQQAEASAKQLEGLLADSEAERRTLRAKYISLGAPAAAAALCLWDSLHLPCFQAREQCGRATVCLRLHGCVELLC